MPGAARRWWQDWESEMSLVTQHDFGILMMPAATMIDCEPRFEIIPGTRLPEHDAFEVEVGADP